MYPCSNPELVAAISRAGALGVIQPLSLTFVHGWEFRAGIRHILTLTDRPVGMNALIEQSSRTYRRRMEGWIATALEEGIRFFITSLGNPDWVVRMVEPHGGVVYHDVTEARWAEKGVKGGARGLIAVNRDAGGHAGNRTAEALFRELAGLDLPVVAAGGAGDPARFRQLLDIGYAAVQCGTRFIASTECTASDRYKAAIVEAGADDIVMSERITGVPVAVIRTPEIEREGTRAGPIGRRLLGWRRARHLMRTIYSLRSIWKLRRSSYDTSGRREYWQAGRSVSGIAEIIPAGEIVSSFAEAWRREDPPFQSRGKRDILE